VGGLIGHFATKSQLKKEDTTPTPSSGPSNSASKSDKVGDVENRKKLFSFTDAEEIRKVAK